MVHNLTQSMNLALKEKEQHHLTQFAPKKIQLDRNQTSVPSVLAEFVYVKMILKLKILQFHPVIAKDRAEIYILNAFKNGLTKNEKLSSYHRFKRTIFTKKVNVRYATFCILTWLKSKISCFLFLILQGLNNKIILLLKFQECLQVKTFLL